MDPRVAIDRLLDRYPASGALREPTFGALVAALTEDGQAELLEQAFAIAGQRLVASPHFALALDDPVLSDLFDDFARLVREQRAISDPAWQRAYRDSWETGFLTMDLSIPRSWHLRELAMMLTGGADDWQHRLRARREPLAEEPAQAPGGWLVVRGPRKWLPATGGPSAQRQVIEPRELASSMSSTYAHVERIDAGTMPPWRDAVTGDWALIDPPSAMEEGHFLQQLLIAVEPD